jgi:6-phospho-beta-glucosidase
MSLKLTLIGGGSAYTPEVIDGLIQNADALPFSHVALHDVDARRIEILTGMTRRMLEHAGLRVKVTATTERRAALEGADFVIVQIRVGGNRARVLDEKIPLKYGLLGQETTGAGGFANALRTVPVVLDIARDVEQVAPHAWVLNYTNPAGLITEAVVTHTKAKMLGMCSGYTYPLNVAAAALNVSPESLRMDYVGLNHLAWAYRFVLDGKDVTAEVLSRLPQDVMGMERELIQALGMIPMPYVGYFYHHDRYVEKQRQARHTRGEEVLEIEEKLLRLYADEKTRTVPDLLRKRGNGQFPRAYSYADVSFAVMKSIAADDGKRHIVNASHQGAVRGFGVCDDATAVLEMPVAVHRDRVVPLAIGELPLPIRGLVHAVKTYEQLTLRAAITGDRHTALLALLAHPLIGNYDIAKSLLDELLEAQREHLPQFQRTAKVSMPPARGTLMRNL